MNKRNWKKAMRWVRDTPEHEINMESWYQIPVYNEGWGIRPSFLNVRNLNLILKVFHKEGSLPCGTTSCLAGTIDYNLGPVDPGNVPLNTDLGMSIQQRAADFLGITRSQATKLFQTSRFYGRNRLKDVTKQMLLDKMEEIYNEPSLLH